MMRAGFIGAFLLLFAGAAFAQDRQNLILHLELADKSAFRVKAVPSDWHLQVDAKTDFKPETLDRLRANPAIRDASLRMLENGWQGIAIAFSGGFELARTGYSDGAVLEIELMPVQTEGPDPQQLVESTAPQKPIIVIDAGHGGIDSGAFRDDIRESDLMLDFAKELSEAIIRSGRFQTKLTREGDHFLRLSEQIEIARQVGAAAFISLHADALSEGKARGAAVFTLSDKATSVAAPELVEFHKRSDIFVNDGVEGVEDDIATILINMTQRDTNPRSISLSNHLVAALADYDATLRKRARQSGNFGVLKAPDIPSVLIELGFMSDEADLENLMNADWRTGTVAALLEGLLAWADAEEAAILGRE